MKLGSGARKRRAVSPIIGEVLLMAATLIVGVAMGGFFFGVLGGFASTPRVSATATTCTTTGGAGPYDCSLSLTNTGSANAQIAANTCTINLGGALVTGTNAKTTVDAGSSVSVGCSVSTAQYGGAAPPLDTPATGALPTGTLGTVAWYGMWSS